jgi:hypothetical protein
MVNKYKFAVIVDEQGRRKPKLNEFIDLLKEDYPRLQESRRYGAKRIGAARKGDVIIFGISSKYDYRLMSKEEFEEYSDEHHVSTLYLSEDFELVEESLELYVRKLRKKKNNKKDDCCNVYVYIDDDCSLYYEEQQEQEELYLDKMQVFHNFVKVGYDVYDIYLDESDNEFVKIDGRKYWIDRDYYGNGKVSVR